MKTTLPPRRTLLLYSWSGERRRGKVFERLKHKNHDTPSLAYKRQWLLNPNGKNMPKNSNLQNQPADSPNLYPFDVLSDYNSKSTVAEIYDDPEVAASLHLMFPWIEYSDLSYMTIDEVSRKARKEIWGGVVNSEKHFILELDIGLRAYCASLEDASDICKKYLTKHNVCSQGWRGGALVRTTSIHKPFATIDYEGNVHIIPLPAKSK